jgi:hypothetical protein
MTNAGLLQGHRIRVKGDYLDKALRGIRFSEVFGYDGPPPGVFVRYTLPGMLPSLVIDKKDKKPIFCKMASS